MRSKMLALSISIVAGMVIGPALAKADEDSESRIRRGFAISPVKLNLVEKNRALVGLGSYLVNAVGSCNDCHTNPNYAPGGNPFLEQPKQVNTAGYLAGGRLFNPPGVVSRNLTPDKTGLPEGGVLFDVFLRTMRTGFDRLHAHPRLSPLLQVMPWPVFQDMTDLDLRAVYEYLSAIPCVEDPPNVPDARPAGTRCI
ncbi:MAG TPA: hypothetical protein VKT99_02765 [Xanthobacteraceae bacterium]|jgi:hypothetical protein|nr:hypothetical protein [Xanthobacteraceae bacterium]